MISAVFQRKFRHSFNFGIVRISCEAQSSALQLFIEFIQINIGKQWTEVSALCRDRYYAEKLGFCA